MARRPEPWYRKQCKGYYVTIRGTQHRLSPDKKGAYKQFHELIAKPEGVIASGAVAGLSDAFEAGCVAAVKRIFNWAVDQGYIEQTAFRGLKRRAPGQKPRRRNGCGIEATCPLRVPRVTPPQRNCAEG